MTLKEAHGKQVKIILKDGQIYSGLAYDYTSALDNEPEPESITVGQTELYAPEIKSIELI
ncbi:hypothetical protein [Scatolibacter rhodanostii]|uniref:hypothetical protein n=1 Tax=Scatolibacter rhodanostii TaxID=2014781 RepID=UPI000C06D8E9|nr:hypothetical protein [Scatolibacter rhodanostii]